MSTLVNHRRRALDGAALERAPVNELGVVVLFAQIAPKLQLRIAEIRAAFPDCIAYQRAGKVEKQIRIEFEFRSSNFRTHGHSPRMCDWIVCWEHDWQDCPKRLTVVELRHFFDHGLQVWFAVGPPMPYEKLPGPATNWIQPHRPMRRDDLVVIYEWSPLLRLRFIYRVTGNRTANDIYELRRVAYLQRPILFKDMKEHPLLKGIDLFKGKWNRNITEHWWRLHELIVRRNPDLTATLQKYGPEHV